MGFRENLIQKVQIKQLAEQVERSLRPTDPPQRIDRSAMLALLEMSDYAHRHERDLDLYCRDRGDGDKPLIIVLDNELKLYHTTVEDVVLRKSPTVKEMVNIRNAIKILNDKDVVVSRKNETLRRLRMELIDALDLAYGPDDIAALETDGRQALKNGYADGILEILSLFADLLGFEKAPPALQAHHHHVWGAQPQRNGIGTRVQPVVLFSSMDLSLKMLNQPINTLDKATLAHFQQVVSGEARADLEGPDVFTALKKEVLSEGARAAK